MRPLETAAAAQARVLDAVAGERSPAGVRETRGIHGSLSHRLHTTLDISAFVIGAGGVADFHLPFPGIATFLGVSFAAQAASLDPFANALGMTTTNAALSTIGW